MKKVDGDISDRRVFLNKLTIAGNRLTKALSDGGLAKGSLDGGLAKVSSDDGFKQIASNVPLSIIKSYDLLLIEL